MLRALCCVVADVITIDIPNRRLDVELDPETIAARLAIVERVEKPAFGYVERYRRHVKSAARGAVLG